LGRGLATRALIQHLVELRALAVMGPVYGRQAAVFFRLRRCLAP
jgi:hypothetical protein